MATDIAPRYLLALESSTAHGGAALIREGKPVAAIFLEEGLRHGRQLLAAANDLLTQHGLKPRELHAVAVSIGPGSYTGVRVGAMAAKALAYASPCLLTAVSSLAALAETARLDGKAKTGDLVLTLQDARRDELYAALYKLEAEHPRPVNHDAAITPEEAAQRISFLPEDGDKVVFAGSSFTTYKTVLGNKNALPGQVNPEAVGVLGWQQLMQEISADPLQLQPVYLRRDSEADWRHDHLIQPAQ